MIARREFLKLLAGAAVAAVVPLPKPEEPLGLLGLIDDGTYVDNYMNVRRGLVHLAGNGVVWHLYGENLQKIGECVSDGPPVIEWSEQGMRLVPT